MALVVAQPDDAAAVCVQIATTEVPRLSIAWDKVSFQVTVKNPQTNQSETKQILKNVTGEALPGELVVIMGPSGAGKSTLLDCISCRNSRFTGEVSANGHKWSSAIAKHACYVMQDDLFYANLTVREHLLFQAELRMARTASSQVRQQRVMDVINELGLNKCEHTLIGGGMVKGLSGGQRKRLTFATELLTNPSLLFVDEPTSGLDSFMAETVILQMRDLAKRGRTVLTTIHQPSSELFQVFDRLYLLADGNLVYDGKANESMAYFESIGHACPPFINPADHYMRLLVILEGDPEAKTRVSSIVRAWQTKAQQQQTASSLVIDTANKSSSRKILASDGGDLTDSGSQHIGLIRQLAVLCRRNWCRLFRDVVAFRARFGSALFIAFMAGLVYLQLHRSQNGIQDFTGAIFFVTLNQFMSAANPEFVTVPLEIPIVVREHAGGLYHGLTWYVAKNLSELPLQTLFPMLFLLPSYFLIGFGGDVETFFTFYLFSVLVNSCATGVGYMVSCVARRVETAPIIGIVLLLPFLLFGGLFLNGASTPDYLIWLQQISPTKYAFHGMMRAFWSKVKDIPCDAAIEHCIATTGQQVLHANSIDDDMNKLARDAGLLVAINVGFRSVGGVLLWWRLKRNKFG